MLTCIISVCVLFIVVNFVCPVCMLHNCACGSVMRFEWLHSMAFTVIFVNHIVKETLFNDG